MPKMKEQDKTLEKELSKMEARNLLDTKFKPLVIRISRILVRTLIK